MQLEEEFLQLPTPHSDSPIAFSAFEIVDYENHRIAKNVELNPCLLISVSRKSPIMRVSRHELFSLSITHNLKCEVQVADELSTKVFTVISYTGNDDELKNYFLRACEILIPSMGRSPDEKDIQFTVNKFIELFRDLREPTTRTIQGLWAELFVINQSKKPEEFISAWHNRPEDKFDFSQKKIKFEVKSSSNQERNHHFSQVQLNPMSKFELFVLSIFTEEDSNGKSVHDLLGEIGKKLNNNQRAIEKLNFVALSTLRSSISQAASIRFDNDLAKKSFKVFNAKNIPTIHDIPPNISDVRFKCSLDSIQHEKPDIDSLIKST